MYSRLIQLPAHKSFFLLGPRGTGKTTLVKSLFPNALYIDLLEAQLFTMLLADPQRLDKLIPANFRDWIIIDEIQRIPELLHEIHRLIENNKYRFILTGSSARKLRRKGPNLLAGRALTCFLHPLIAQELSADFNLQHSLKYGTLPCVYVEPEPQKYLASYVKTYLEEEVRQEGLTRNLASFARFLEAASFSQGCVLNISQVARECSVERKVVENYFNILEDLLIAYRVPIFSKRAKRRMTAHQKFYFFDAGVYRAIRPGGPLDVPEEIEGAACETLLFQTLLALNDAYQFGYKIFFWRTSTNLEVDFVLYGQKGIIAFEIKRTQRITRSMLSGLNAFLEDYPTAKAYCIYGGERYLRERSIELLPIERAFQQLPKLLNMQAFK